MEQYVDMTEHNFLNFFERPDENGDVIYEIKNFSGGKFNPDDLSNEMISSGFGVFGVSCEIPELVEKMDIELIEEDGKNFVVFQLAPFFGLPNENGKNELKELKEFLEWIKQEAIGNPKNRVDLMLDRCAGEVNFKLYSDSHVLKKELNEKMEEKINSSEVLKVWLENQKNGYKEVEKQCDNLYIVMSSFSLMNLDEQMTIVDSREEVEVIKKHVPLKNKLRKRF